MWLSLLSLTYAGEELVSVYEAAGTAVHQAGMCASLDLWAQVFDDANPLGTAIGAPQDFLGTDRVAPVTYAIVGADGDRSLSVGLSEPDVFEAFLPRLFPGAIESDGVYRLADGRVARVELADDRAWIVVSGRARGGLPTDELDVRFLAERVPEDRCAFVRTDRALGVAFGTTDSVDLILPPPPILPIEHFETGPPQLRTRTKPLLVARANLDVEALLSVDAPAGTPGGGQMLGAMLSASGVDVEPGLEVAVWMSEQVVLLAPVGSARIARRLVRRAARADEAVGVADGVLQLETEVGPIWLTAVGAGLVLSNDATLARDARDPTAPLALAEHPSPSAPGLVGSVDPPPGMLEAMGVMALDQAFDFQIGVPTDFAEARVHAVGVGVAAADAFWPDAPADPIGSPPSTEALSVLMTIATAEETHRAETDLYLPYAGGPRELDALDGEAVPWAGIPGLGVGPMATTCRYEVQLTGDGYSARSICDEDGDGRHAITVMGPGGRPSRVTPEEVR
ncbi:MAG: hypothetical protein GY884_05990 [Proteobacteria bacterium]|nr:hypothetical protein [Pseudomonadota bacterium]